MAWEVSAGLAREVSPGCMISLGVRCASLGTYRLTGRDGPARVSLDGSEMEIAFGDRSALYVREVAFSIRHEF